MIIEIIGYIGSALVVVSMLMSSILRLRIINTIGSVISCTYALIVGAMPLALMNACLIVINLYNLYKLTKTKKPYDMVICDADDGMVQYLLSYYGDDIRKIFPDFDDAEISGKKAYMVLCEGNPAGMLIGKHVEGRALEGDESSRFLDIDIDYAAPAYRDFTVADYLYKKLPERGINRVRYRHSLSEGYEDYLRRTGYVPEDGAWVLHIKH